MKQFFSDDRIPTGSKVLLNAYFYRMQKGSEEMIDSIVLFENKNQPQKAQNGYKKIFKKLLFVNKIT